MSRTRFSLLLSLLSVLCFTTVAQAVEIVGRVTNRTSNQPVAGQEVTLLALRGGMAVLATTDTDGAGRFRFVVAANPNENFLVRVAYQGVNYHQPAMLAGGERIAADLEVYERTSEASGIERAAHNFFLEPHADHVRVTEVILFANRTRPGRTYLPGLARESLLAFRTPAGAGDDVRAVVIGPGGMPLRQQPQPGEEPNIHTLNYPLRPGTTQIEFSYVVPLAEDRYDFAKPLARAAEPPRIVTPLAGIRLTGPALGAVQEEPSRQARIYTVRLSGENELRFRIEVDPSALAARPPGEGAATGQTAGATGEGSVTLIPNPVSEAKWYIVGLTLTVLAFGLYYLYSLAATARTPDESKPRSKARR
ncbi:MAG: hypothetical protein ACE5H2_07030 [Terriglobia bacterium]